MLPDQEALLEHAETRFPNQPHRARATSAAPLYYKPFIKAATGVAFTDGGLYHNCPAWIAHHERRVLWDDATNQDPDMFLSIGTGVGSQDVARGAGDAAPTAKPVRRPTAGIVYAMRTGYTILDDQLNCEKTWREYLATQSVALPEQARRTMRLNVRFPGVRPKLDEVKSLADVEEQARESAARNPDVREIAHRLVASSFYFEKQAGAYPGGGYTCEGNPRAWPRPSSSQTADTLTNAATRRPPQASSAAASRGAATTSKAWARSLRTVARAPSTRTSTSKRTTAPTTSRSAPSPSLPPPST